jgi:protein phosphatase
VIDPEQVGSIDPDDQPTGEHAIVPENGADIDLSTTDDLPVIPDVTILTPLAERDRILLFPGKPQQEYEQSKIGIVKGCQETNFGIIACLRSAGQSSRSSDEDGAIFISLGGNDYFVSIDGLGGHGSGKLATDTAIHVISARLESSHCLSESIASPEDAGKDAALEDTTEMGEPIDKAVGAIGQMLEVEYRERSKLAFAAGEVGPSSEMGLCLTAMQVTEGAEGQGQRGRFVNTGDSRAIVVRDDKLFFQTHDQSLAQEMVDAGVLDEKDALTFGGRHVVTGNVRIEAGKNASTPTDVTDIELMAGDMTILASDGLWDNFSSDDVVAMTSGLSNPYEILLVLSEAVADRVKNHAGKDDNLNIIVYLHGKQPFEEKL